MFEFVPDNGLLLCLCQALACSCVVTMSGLIYILGDGGAHFILVSNRGFFSFFFLWRGMVALNFSCRAVAHEIFLF